MNISNPNPNSAPLPWHVSLALLDLVVGHKHTRRSRMSWSASSGMGLCASLVCSLFSSGVSCGWVLSGAVGCCRVSVGSVGLSGPSGCVRSVGLTLKVCTRPHRHFAVGAVGLSGCRGIGWCRVVSGCRGGVGLVSDDSVGLSNHPSGRRCFRRLAEQAAKEPDKNGMYLVNC